MLDLAMFKLLLLVAAIPFGLIGAVLLAVRLIRFARAHRGEAIVSLIAEDLRGQFVDALENWVDEPSHDSSHEGESDHHHAHPGNDSHHH